MRDVSSIVSNDPQVENNSSSSKVNKNIQDEEGYEEPVILKRKRGRPPKKAAAVKIESESDSDKYEYNSDDSEDIEDYDIFDNDDDPYDNTGGRKKRGKKRKHDEEEAEESTGFEDLDSGDEKEQALLQEQNMKYGSVNFLFHVLVTMSIIQTETGGSVGGQPGAGWGG